MISTFINRRTTPFILIFWLSGAPTAWATEPTGRWLFVDDGSGVEIKPCPIAASGLRGTLVQLPKSAASLTLAQRKQLCGVTIIGALKIGTPKLDEKIRLEGWVIDPEDLSKTEHPKRYPTSLIVTSNVSAKLEVRGPFNIVLESYRLIRPVVPGTVCE
jgi:hypothetical protein